MGNYDYFTLSDGTEVTISYTKPEKNMRKGYVRLNDQELTACCDVLAGEEYAYSQIYGTLKAQAELALDQFKEQHKENL